MHLPYTKEFANKNNLIAEGERDGDGDWGVASCSCSIFFGSALPS